MPTGSSSGFEGTDLRKQQQTPLCCASSKTGGCLGKQFKNLSPQFYIANKVELIVGLTRSSMEMKNDKPVCVSVISNDKWRKRKHLVLIGVLLILFVVSIFEIVG